MYTRGLATDSLNQQTVTADSKGVVKFWRFKEAKLLHKVKKQVLLFLTIAIATIANYSWIHRRFCTTRCCWALTCRP